MIENAPEGTSLNFEGGLNVIEDLDKVSCNETYLEYKFFNRYITLFHIYYFDENQKNYFPYYCTIRSYKYSEFAFEYKIHTAKKTNYCNIKVQ